MHSSAFSANNVVPQVAMEIAHPFERVEGVEGVVVLHICWQGLYDKFVGIGEAWLLQEVCPSCSWISER